MSQTVLLVFAGVAVALLHHAAADSPWVYSDNAPIPDGVLRITTLGSGSPDVRREQVGLQPVIIHTSRYPVSLKH